MKHETSNGTPELSAALLERAKTGDREALAGLYTATELEIYRTVHAILKDEELCRDVQQDAYLRAFSRLEELRDPAAFLPWLRQIAVNEARMQLRRKRPLLFSELSVEPDAGEPELPDLRAEASPELSLERKENARLVREILDGLPEGQRLLLGMFYYEQIPIKEIAADTGLSEGTVKAQLFRGRKRVETEVKRLEEKGVKLYGLSPLPFLLALLRRQEPAAEAGKTLMAETFTRAGIAPAAEAVGLHVGRSFFQTGLGKLVLGVIAAGIVAGGVAGYRWARTNFNLGDVRPTENLEIQLHYDSEEDLTTEPTVDLSLPTESDVPTDPLEPDTKPETDENLIPESSEPSEPTESEAPTDPAGADDPAPSNQLQPTESEPGETQELRVSWAWDTGGPMDWTVTGDETGYTESRVLTVALSVSEKAELSTDEEGIVAITQVRYNAYLDKTGTNGSGEWAALYQWEITPLADGVTQIHCVVDGKVKHTLTVTVATPVKLLRSDVTQVRPYYEYTENTMKNCVVGMEYELIAKVLGTEAPSFSTDNGAVVRLGAVSEEQAAAKSRYYSVKLQIIGAGDAQVFLSLNGRTEKTWTIHASKVTVDYSDSQEDLLPFDAEPQVMSWYVNTYFRPVLLHQGCPESLYVKMKGNEPPLLTVDDPSVISLSPERNDWYEDRNVTEYWYQLTPLRSGVCTLKCSFRGKVEFSVPIVVP